MEKTNVIAAGVVALLLAAPAAGATLEALPSVNNLPDGYLAVDDVVPSLGQPFALKEGKVGKRHYFPGPPVYYVYKGKVIGSAIFLDKVDFDRGLSFENIPLPAWAPPVDHLDVEQHDEGSPGMGPSVIVHAFFLSSDDLDKIQF
jgi:hypothetical protein